jgi:cytochrome c2
MRKKWILVVGLLVIIGLFAKVGLARAGGWATLTLSELPTEVVAERPFTIEFRLLQHGHTPITGSDVTTRITAIHPTSGAEVQQDAVPGEEPGIYIATLVLPQPGEWQWEIFAFAATYSMPSLMVNEAAMATGDVVVGTALAWQLVLGWIAAVGAILFLFFWTRQRDRLRLAGAVLFGVVSVAGFGLYAQMPQPVLAESEMATVPAIAPEAMGEALFVAKGCIQCHTNDNVKMAENMLSIGPDITFVKRSPEYLQAWLTDPSSLKTDTQMPNLHLSEAEIDTLIAFLQKD